MKILPEPLSFDWDQSNLDKNFIKHGVSNKEAEEVFESEQVLNFTDEKHSQSERRYMIWGITKEGRKLAVFFTFRNGCISVISTRDMHKKERREYEEKIKTNTKI